MGDIGLRTAAPGPVVVLAMILALVVPIGQAGASTATNEGGPVLDAAAWLLVDSRDGQVLAAANEDQQRPIASTTKMMTGWLATRHLDLNDIARAANYRADPVESVMGLYPGELISVRDLLYGLFLLSGNDAAVTLAQEVAGRLPRFVRMMNAEAERLGLTETGFANPIGLDAPGNYSTATDLAKLAGQLMRDPDLRRIVGSREAVLRSLVPSREIVTRNTLLFELPWANGVKTGQTMGAGNVLVGSGRRDRVELIAVVLGTESIESRDAETAKLLEYGMSLYERRPLLGPDRVARRLKVRHSDRRLPLRPARPFGIGIRGDQEVDVRLVTPREVEGPIAIGETIGRAVVVLDGARVAVIPLLAGADIPEATFADRLRHWSLRNVVIGLIALFVILISAALIRRRRREHPRRGLRG